MDILFLIAAAILAALLGSLIYARIWDRGLFVDVHFQDHPAVEGEKASLTEVITNQKLLPLPILRVKFQIDRNLEFLSGENTSVSDKSYRHDIFSVMLYQKITRRLPFICRRRGYYTVEGLDLLTYNLFFTGRMVRQLSANTHLYVYPAPVDPARLSIPLRQLMGEIVSRRYAYQDPFLFQGIREYQPFDAMSAVNWKATARTDELKVNVNGCTSSQEVCLLLNLESETVWEYAALKEESIRLAAALGQSLIARGIPVALYSNGADLLTGKPAFLPAGSAASHTTALFETLSRVDCRKGVEPFARILEQIPTGDGARQIYVTLSTSQRGDTLAALARLAGVSSGQDSAYCLFLCPLHPDMELRPPAFRGMQSYRWEVPYDKE